MKKLAVWATLTILVVSSFSLMGCSGDAEDSTSNKEAIDKANKSLPPIDPKAPPPVAPVREDMGKGGNMPMKGGK